MKWRNIVPSLNFILNKNPDGMCSSHIETFFSSEALIVRMHLRARYVTRIYNEYFIDWIK